MPKLTQNQRTLLDAAAAAPLQTVSIDDLDGKPRALVASARALARRGLITMVDGEGDAGLTLSLTEDGRTLCSPDTPQADDRPAEPAKIAEEASAPQAQETNEATGRATKKAAVMDLLSRESGASIAELQIATGRLEEWSFV